MELSTRLRQVRQTRHLTQSQLATQLWVTRQTISRWETGATQPPLSALDDLADFYQMSVAELVGGKVIMNKEINYLAVFGSIVFNAIFIIPFGVAFIGMWLMLWLVVVASSLSPIILVVFNLMGSVPFNWVDWSIALILLVASGFTYRLILRLSSILYQSGRHYLRYMFNPRQYEITTKS